MYIQKTYMDMGGKYKVKGKGLATWRKEEWIQVKPYLESGKKLVCGGAERKNKVCRPLKRINDKTPITIEELLKLHSKKDLIALSNKKIKDMKGRVFWKTLKFIPDERNESSSFFSKINSENLFNSSVFIGIASFLLILLLSFSLNSNSQISQKDLVDELRITKSDLIEFYSLRSEEVLSIESISNPVTIRFK